MKKPLLIAALVAAASFPFLASAQPMHEGPLGGLAALEALGGQGHGAGVLAANATIEADQTALEDAFRKLRDDVKAGNTAAITADQAAITAAVAHLQADRAALMAAAVTNAAVQAAKATVHTDLLAIERDRAQLRSDEIAGNKVAAMADEQALVADAARLRADMKTLRDAIAALPI